MSGGEGHGSGLVKMPAPLACLAKLLRSTRLDLTRHGGPEPVPPEPHRLVADTDAKLVEQILHDAQRQRKSNVHHHCQADDLRRGFEVLKWVGHRVWLGRPRTDRFLCQDRALRSCSRLMSPKRHTRAGAEPRPRVGPCHEAARSHTVPDALRRLYVGHTPSSRAPVRATPPGGLVQRIGAAPADADGGGSSLARRARAVFPNLIARRSSPRRLEAQGWQTQAHPG